MPDLAIKILLQVQDDAKEGVKGLGGAFGGLAGTIGGLAVPMATVVKDVVGFAVASTKMAGDYDQGMRKVQALTGSSDAQMQQYDAGLKGLAVDAGVAPQKLTDGLYNVVSAGYQGKNAMNIFTLATEDSKIGMTDAATTTKSLTALLAQFNIGAQDATRVNGEMLATVTLGSGTFEQYSQSIVKAASSASQYHESMETMNAAYATLTSRQINAAQASTDLQQSFKVMDGNIGTVTKSLNKSGIAFDEAKFNAMDYGHKTEYLDAALEKANDKHVKVTGVTIQAAQAIHTIAQNIGVYNNDLKTLSDKQAMAAKTQEAWKTTQGGFNQSMDRLHATLDVVMISVGQKLLPVLTDLAAKLAPIISKFGDWITQSGVLDTVVNVLKNAVNLVGTAISGAADVIKTLKDKINDAITVIEKIKKWFDDWHPVILDVAGAITLFFLPALIGAGAQAVAAGAKIAASFIANMITTGVQAVINAVKVTVSFVASMVTAGATAWVQGPKVIAGFVSSMIAAGTQAVTQGPKVIAGFVSSMTTTGTQAVVNAAKVTASFVASMITTAAQAVASAAKVTASFVASMVTSGATALVQGPKVIAGFVASMITTGAQAVIQAAKVTASFVASMITTGAQAVASAAVVTGSFIASMVMTGVKAVASAAIVVASFVASLITTAAQAVITGAIMFVSLIPALVATAIAALAAAAPFILAGIIIAAAVIGIILVIKNWGAISNWLKGVWGAAIQGIIDFLNMLGIHVGKTTTQLNLEAAKQRDGQLKASEQTQLGTIHHYETMRTGILEKLKNCKTQAERTSLEHQLAVVNAHIKTGVQALSHTENMRKQNAEKMKQMKEKADEESKGLFQKVGDWFGNLFSTCTTWVGNMWKNITGWFAGAWANIGKFLSTLWSNLTTWFENLKTYASNKIADMWTKIQEFFNTAWSNIGQALSTLWSNITTWFENLKTTATNKANELWSQVTGFFSGAWGNISGALATLGSNIQGWFTGLISNAGNWGHNLIQGFIDGISGMIGNVASAASNVAQTVKNFIGHLSPAKMGPGADSDKWAPNLMKMFSQGLMDNIPNLQKAVAAAAQAIQEGMIPDAMAMHAQINAAQEAMVHAHDQKVMEAWNKQRRHKPGTGPNFGSQATALGIFSNSIREVGAIGSGINNPTGSSLPPIEVHIHAMTNDPKQLAALAAQEMTKRLNNSMTHTSMTSGGKVG